MKKILRFPQFNLKVKIVQDENPDSPRTWDNLGKCIFFHKRYNIGDAHQYKADDYEGFEAMKEALIKDGAKVVIPVYMYDHSGQTIATTPFNCRFDSGQLGFIAAFPDDIRESFGCKRISKKLLKRVSACLESEIVTLNQYLTGETYGVKVKDTKTGDKDSCWGFFGDSADNGIFDHVGGQGLTFAEYKEVYDKTDWK